jgi:hypothetical protein
MSDADKPGDEQQVAVPAPLPASKLPKWIPLLPRDFVPAQATEDRAVRRLAVLPKSIEDGVCLERAFARWNQELEADQATRELWGISESLTDSESLPPGLFTFEQAVQQSWCKNPDGKKRTVYGLKRLLRSIETYPPILFERQLISEAGFHRALELQSEKDRKSDTETTQRRRAARRNRLRRCSSS